MSPESPYYRLYRALGQLLFRRAFTKYKSRSEVWALRRPL